jgi:hypothetical protein
MRASHFENFATIFRDSLLRPPSSSLSVSLYFCFFDLLFSSILFCYVLVISHIHESHAKHSIARCLHPAYIKLEAGGRRAEVGELGQPNPTSGAHQQARENWLKGICTVFLFFQWYACRYTVVYIYACFQMQARVKLNSRSSKLQEYSEWRI